MGFLLLLAPLKALTLMGVRYMPCEMVFIQLIGIFVICVGIFYIVPRVVTDLTAQSMTWQTVFVCTGVLRACVALFVVWAFGRGLLDVGWLTVSVYDASLAALQFWVLRRTASI